jgi:hypothetical protein
MIYERERAWKEATAALIVNYRINVIESLSVHEADGAGRLAAY